MNSERLLLCLRTMLQFRKLCSLSTDYPASHAAEGYSPRFAEDDDADFDDLMEQVLRDARSEETRARLEGELVLDSPVGDGKQTYQL